MPVKNLMLQLLDLPSERLQLTREPAKRGQAQLRQPIPLEDQSLQGRADAGGPLRGYNPNSPM